MSKPILVLLTPMSDIHACMVASDSGFGRPEAAPNNKIASMRGWRNTSRMRGFVGDVSAFTRGPVSCSPASYRDLDRAGVPANLHRPRPVAQRPALRQLQAQVGARQS